MEQGTVQIFCLNLFSLEKINKTDLNCDLLPSSFFFENADLITLGSAYILNHEQDGSLIFISS